MGGDDHWLSEDYFCYTEGNHFLQTTVPQKINHIHIMKIVSFMHKSRGLGSSKFAYAILQVDPQTQHEAVASVITTA